MKQLKSCETEEYQLEVFECDCGFHIGIDATWLDQVNDADILISICYSCGKFIPIEDLSDEECDHIWNKSTVCTKCGVSGTKVSLQTPLELIDELFGTEPRFGDRYKYKESSYCRVISEKKDHLGRFHVIWEEEGDTGWVDLSASCYERIKNA